MKKEYIKPRLKVVEFKVENGFAGSNITPPPINNQQIYIGSNERVFGNGTITDDPEVNPEIMEQIRSNGNIGF